MQLYLKLLQPPRLPCGGIEIQTYVADRCVPTQPTQASHMPAGGTPTLLYRNGWPPIMHPLVALIEPPLPQLHEICDHYTWGSAKMTKVLLEKSKVIVKICWYNTMTQLLK